MKKNYFIPTRLLATTALAVSLVSGTMAQTGTNDSTFNTPDSGPNSGPKGSNDLITGSALQSNDKKMVLTGWFTQFNGAPANHIVRINAEGKTDAGFNTGTGFNVTPAALAIQDNNRIIVGGYFTSYNGTGANHIVRLLANGSIDNSFITGTGFDDNVTAILLQPDGKIIVSGGFTHYNGTAVTHIVRLKKNGMLDNTFIASNINLPRQLALQPDGKIILAYTKPDTVILSRLHTDGSSDASYRAALPVTDPEGIETYFPSVYTLAVQADGKVLAGGSAIFGNSPDFSFLTRSNADGTEDTSFHYTYRGNTVQTVKLQDDGKILVGGKGNTSVDGLEWTNAYLIRLIADGSLDPSFIQNVETPVRGNNYGIYTASIQQDGKIIAAGFFSELNSYAAKSITRLNTDGSVDISFNKTTASNGEIRASAIQANGRIVIGGNFSAYQYKSRNHLARLREDGTLDNSFNPGTGTNGVITAVAVQPNGKILAAGYFTTYNDQPAPGLVRINSNGSRDASFNPGTGADNIIRAILVQADNKIIITGDFDTVNGVTQPGVARLNANGSVDAGFTSPVIPSYTKKVYTGLILSSGKILVGGTFTATDGSQNRSHLIRLNTNGSLDLDFQQISSSDIHSLAVQTDGKIVAGIGKERTNNLGFGTVKRYSSDGVFDTSFVNFSFPGETFPIYSVTILPSGKIIAAGHMNGFMGLPVSNIMQLDTTGAIDTTFKGGTNATVYNTHLTADGKLILTGAFTNYTGIARNGIARIHVSESPYGAAPDRPSVAAEDHAFSIYPNPAGSSVNVGNLTPGTTITIRNMVGAVVYKTQVNQQKITLDLSRYSNGMYFITQEGNQKNSTQKLIVANN